MKLKNPLIIVSNIKNLLHFIKQFYDFISLLIFQQKTKRIDIPIIKTNEI